LLSLPPFDRLRDPERKSRGERSRREPAEGSLSGQTPRHSFGILKPRELPAVVLFGGRHEKPHAFLFQLLVRLLEVLHPQSEFDLSGRVFAGSRVQSERGLAGLKLRPFRRFELEASPDDVAVKLHGTVTVRNEFDDIPDFNRHGSCLRQNRYQRPNSTSRGQQKKAREAVILSPFA